MSVSLETLSIATLADLYNLLAEKPIKKFSDKKSALVRLSALLEEKQHEVFQAGEEYDVRPIAQEEVVAETAAPIATETAPVAPVAQTKTTKGGKRGPAPKHADDDIVTVLSEKNPKRIGTDSWNRFELYGKTANVGEFLASGGTRADLEWDLKHGFIVIK